MLRSSNICLAASLLALTLVAARARASGPLWLVAEQDERSAMHALVRTRVERELALARTDYADSRFDACAGRLTRLEEHVRWQIRSARTLPLVKQLNLWLGLCRGVADQRDAARAAFTRAARLPGPGPDPSLFPPGVMELYRSSRALEGGCRIQLSGSTKVVEIDGRQVRAGAEVAPGEHYVVWDGRSDLRRVGGDCRLDLEPPPPAPALRLEPEEAASPGFLQALGQAAGQERITLARGGGARVTLSVFDVTRRRFVSEDAPLGGSPPPRRPGIDSGPADGREDAKALPWYGRWWVWALVGTAVVTAVVVPVVVTQAGSTRYQVTF